MEDIIKLALEIISKYGLKAAWTLAFIGVMGSYVYWKFYKDNKTITNSALMLKQQDLYNHNLFHALRKYLYHDIQYLQIGEPLREAIFRDFLTINFTTVKYELLNLLNKGDLEDLDDMTFLARALKCVDNTIKNYESRAIDEGIPLIIIEKFNQWHQVRIDATYAFLNEINDSNLFKSNVAKTSVIFDFITHILNMTICDAQKTLKTLNGELDKIEYKGIKVNKNVPH